MANDMLIKASFLLSILLTLSTSEQILCCENNALLETTGDAILTVFVDANYGQHCNVSSNKGLQQILTILHVVRTLNKYNHIPNVKLGLRIFDTCHDRITVFRQVLRMAVEQSCAPDYEMGILMPSQYGAIMEYLHSYNALRIGIYKERDFTVPMIDILAHYLSTKYKIVDLVHANTESVLDHFLEVTKDAGVCVKRSDRHVNGDRYVNVTETVIVAIGKRNDVQRWLEENEKLRNFGETWILLPLDNTDINDLIPSESYVIKPEIPRFDLGEFSSAGEFLENFNNSANHSPYLLDIGKAVIKLAEVFQDFRKRNCSIDEESSIMTQSSESQTLESQREIRDFDVYEYLHMQPESHLLRYVVTTKMQHEFIDVAFYEIEMPKLRVLPKRTIFEMPGLCLEHLIKNCENCTNFQSRGNKDVVGKNVLKNSFYVPVFLIVIICGILVCCGMIIFIIYYTTAKEILHGNLVFTIVLVLANLFILLTALSFYMTDDYFGAENLNAWKILLTTLAFGLTFSIMLSRALFLALSTGGVFIIHINGYLQSLMALFACGVQIAMSIMYFVLSTMNSAVVIRSLIFLALLGYDIFLLIALFVTCYFIIRIQHNYHEEKYFFGASIGLLVIWVIWLTCFILMQPENRDAVIFFGTVATAYLIIFGVLVPRIYYITHIPKRKDSTGQRFDPVNLLTDSTVNTIIRQELRLQSCSSHDYVYPARESQILRMPSACPNYYGNLSSNSKYFERCRSPNHYEMPTYNNYECYAEMKEIDATYITPRMYVENTEFLATNNVIYAQPKIYKSQRISLEERSNTETTCNRDNSSPISKQHIEMYSIRYTSPTNMVRERRIDEEEIEEEEEKEEDENDEEDEGASRITRL
ncbi:PREDICTED: protein bride of sevenless isoform X2 [Acromyrmex echinatior]|uniref:protein bride of sevenless isoform X2 n=1 Tax=Acromyrmex echinatior TaxID=103372 RepID=UPI000580C1BD|nr:PREDICTED: protein bride of sevenless isoform X2 [Acromyrmex echinatior]